MPVWSVSGLWLPALGGSHGITLRAEVWAGSSQLATLDVAEASITVSAKNRVRRSLSLVVPEALYPSEPTDLLAPYGNELRVWRGIDYGATSEEVPVFRGRIKTVTSQRRYDGQLTVTADDLMAGINDARFESPRAAPATFVTGAIATLISEASPIGTTLVVGPGVRDSVVPAGLLWDRDRGQAVDDLGQSIGCATWFDPLGIPHLTAPALLSDPAVWTITDGQGGTAVSDGRAVSREGVYSVVVVVIERADGSPPINVSIIDDNPASPTYALGPFGRVPRFYRSPLVTTLDQAVTAGQALLARSTGLTRTRTITCVPNPALEAGDRVDIVVNGELEQHIVDEYTCPLGATSQPMSLATRSAKADPGDS